MKILVTGANGQLGRCIQDLSHQDPYVKHDYIFTDVAELDICDAKAVTRIVEQNHPDYIINAAAYTAVDQAEEESALAYRINHEAVRNLAQTATKNHIHLVHISTDYVFSGEACHPYKTTDKIDPKSIYGKSKAAGEEAIRSSNCDATIIRTSWLYSEYGKNFVKTMLHLGKERKRLQVVYDQVGCPTYAGDLAKAIFSIIETVERNKGFQIFHYANRGVTSWYDFAQNIMEIAGIDCEIEPILSKEYPAKASRPAYSVFELNKFNTEISTDIPYWTDSLRLVINKLRE